MSVLNSAKVMELFASMDTMGKSNNSSSASSAASNNSNHMEHHQQQHHHHLRHDDRSSRNSNSSGGKFLFDFLLLAKSCHSIIKKQSKTLGPGITQFVSTVKNGSLALSPAQFKFNCN